MFQILTGLFLNRQAFIWKMGNEDSPERMPTEGRFLSIPQGAKGFTQKRLLRGKTKG